MKHSTMKHSNWILLTRIICQWSPFQTGNEMRNVLFDKRRTDDVATWLMGDPNVQQMHKHVRLEDHHVMIPVHGECGLH